MKKNLLILVTIVFTTITFAQKSMTFTAEIANRNSDKISFITPQNKNVKDINVNDKGIFNSIFEIEEGMYMLFDGAEYTQVYLKNGMDLSLKMDAKEFDESIKYSGEGSKENNFLAQSALLDEGTNMEEMFASDEKTFNDFSDKLKNSQLEMLENAGLSEKFIELKKQDILKNHKGMRMYYKDIQEQTKANSKLLNKPSASFDYVNHAGGKTKLEDFKGKYVYIDVWATWCGPCRAEIPFLQKVEDKFHDKKIAFISISVDVDKDFEKWKKFVTDKKLGGIQLFADKNWNSDFIKSFGINSIPRFILIDPNGNILDADAKRPSNPKLTAQLEDLLK